MDMKPGWLEYSYYAGQISLFIKGREMRKNNWHGAGGETAVDQINAQGEEQHGDEGDDLVDQVEDDEADHGRPKTEVIPPALGANTHDRGALDDENHHGDERGGAHEDHALDKIGRAHV